jgi:MYXO-CTERM domain-containing protein
VLYDSTGDPPIFAQSIYSVGPIYESFSTGANTGALSLLELSLAVGFSDSTYGITVGLYSDSSTSPGSLITTLATIPDSSLSTVPTLTNVSLSSNPLLTSGTRYWIGLSAGGPGQWNYSITPGGTGVAGEYFDTFAGVYPTADALYLMEVGINNSPPSTSTPEPGTCLLTAGGIGLLFAWRRRAA